MGRKEGREGKGGREERGGKEREGRKEQKMGEGRRGKKKKGGGLILPLEWYDSHSHHPLLSTAYRSVGQRC